MLPVSWPRPGLELLEDRAVPAVGLSVVNDNWAIAADNDHNGFLSFGDTVLNENDSAPGTVTGTFGVDAFTLINHAIANTDIGGTVNVLEGTYVENVTVNKNRTPQSQSGRNMD